MYIHMYVFFMYVAIDIDININNVYICMYIYIYIHVCIRYVFYLGLWGKTPEAGFLVPARLRCPETSDTGCCPTTRMGLVDLLSPLSRSVGAVSDTTSAS